MLAPEFPPHANNGTHAEIPAGVLPRPIFVGCGVFPDPPFSPHAKGPLACRTAGATFPIGAVPGVETPGPLASEHSNPAASFAPPKPRISDIFKKEGRKLLESGRLSPEQGKAVYAIIHCRTETYGYHADVCDCCGFLRIRHNSCRNRHCPTCQGIAKAKWVEQRLSELLPVHCHHAVFTVPSYISRPAMFNRRAMYDLIFDAASRTLLVFGRDPKHLGAEIGFYGILHTWSQLMEPHVHVHFIVVCGGLADDGQWKEPKHGAKFLFPTRALSKVFRRKFVEGLKKLYYDDKLVVPESMDELRNPEGFEKKLDKVVSKPWSVYCKPPFSGPDEVVRYIGRYTHRIAISDGRIVSFENGRVRFKYKDNREKGPGKKTQGGRTFGGKVSEKIPRPRPSARIPQDKKLRLSVQRQKEEKHRNNQVAAARTRGRRGARSSERSGKSLPRLRKRRNDDVSDRERTRGKRPNANCPCFSENTGTHRERDSAESETANETKPADSKTRTRKGEQRPKFRRKRKTWRFYQNILRPGAEKTAVEKKILFDPARKGDRKQKRGTYFAHIEARG